MGFHTLRFRVDDPAGAGGGGEPEAPAPSEPAAPITPPAAPPPSSGWTGPSREEWEQTKAFQDAILTALMEDDGTEPAAPAAPEVPDLSTPEKVEEFIAKKADEIAERKLAERLGPYQPVLDEQVAEKGKALVHAELTKIAKGDPARGIEAVGEFDLDMAGKIAQSFHMAGIPPEQAILLAARETRAYEERIRQGALTAQQGQINNRIDADRAPAPGSAATENDQGFLPGEDKYARQAREWQERRRASGSPVG